MIAGFNIVFVYALFITLTVLFMPFSQWISKLMGMDTKGGANSHMKKAAVLPCLCALISLICALAAVLLTTIQVRSAKLPPQSKTISFTVRSAISPVLGIDGKALEETKGIATDNGAASAIGADVQQVPIASVGPGPSFAIADFDGDQRLDLARVEGGQTGSSSTDYRIEFRLTATKGLQLIRLVAPAGGLVIQALDVNGDHAVDLVLTTPWFKKPVAVLLNDGHGRFSRVEPGDFPGAFTHSDRNWDSSSNQASGALGIPPHSSSDICSHATNLADVRGLTGSVRTANSGFRLHSFLIAYAGRAPPFETPQV